MNILHSRSLKNRAAGLLEQADYSRLVMLHAAVLFGASALIVLLQLLINWSTSNDAGLSGMGTSAIFVTARTTLGTLANLLLPFWEIGIFHTSIRVMRRQDTQFSQLAQGFRRFGPVLRYNLLLILLYIGVIMLLSNLLPLMINLYPIPEALMQSIRNLDVSAASDPVALMEQLPFEQLMAYILPITGWFMLLCGGVMIYISYRFRMSQYLLMDDPGANAMPALVISNQMVRGHKWSLCKLDLSFWWYYLLQLGAAALAFGPDIVKLAGIELGISAEVEMLLFQLLSAAASVAIAWRFGAYVQLTYACAYDQLRNPPQDDTVNIF